MSGRDPRMFDERTVLSRREVEALRARRVAEELAARGVDLDAAVAACGCPAAGAAGGVAELRLFDGGTGGGSRSERAADEAFARRRAGGRRGRLGGRGGDLK